MQRKKALAVKAIEGAFALFLGLSICSGSSASEPDSLGPLKFITENYAPYNYQSEGKVQGIAIDLLLRVFRSVGTNRGLKDIEIMNWARGYKLAQVARNTVLFSTTRTESRENLFKWVGPITATTVSIIAKSNRDIRLRSDKDLEGYWIGTVRDDIGELLVLRKGISRRKVYRTNGAKSAARMLISGRIDLWAYERTVALWNLRALGENVDDYRVLTDLETSQLYFAIQKDTDDKYVEAFQQALDRVRAEAN